MEAGTKVVGYVRVSTDKQGERGAGATAQRDAIRQECERRGWTLLRVEQDVLSGKSMRRPGLAAALAACRTGKANGIVVMKLDRLSRSVIDAGKLLEEAQRDGWNLVALDFGLDFSTPQGELVAHVLTAVAQWERRIIGERTRAGLAVVARRTPAERKALGKKPIGRPPVLDPQVRKRIRNLRTRGWSYGAIADVLNAEGVPTGQGGRRWYAMTVRGIAADFDPDAPKRPRRRAAERADA